MRVKPVVTYTHAINLRYVRVPDIASWLIALKETGRRRFTHVGAITDPDDEGVRYEYGARLRSDGSRTGEPGVQRRPLDYATFEYEALVSIPVTEDEHAAFWRALYAVSGWRYSRRSILGIAAGFEFDDRRGFICSALDLWGLRAAGMLPGELRGDVRDMTPQDSYNLTLGIREGRSASA